MMPIPHKIPHCWPFDSSEVAARNGSSHASLCCSDLRGNARLFALAADKKNWAEPRLNPGHYGENMVGMGRFELPTSPTRKERSTKLSHIPTRKDYLGLDVIS
jgi:hypothetical protein